MIETTQHIREQQGVLGGQTDYVRVVGVVVCAAACFGQDGGEVDDVCWDMESGFEAADEDGDGFGVGIAVGWEGWVSEYVGGREGTNLGGGKVGEVGDG